MRISSRLITSHNPCHTIIYSRPVIEKWTGEEIEDMEAEFDAIDTNDGGMILFQEFTVWAFSKNFDLEDDIDSQDEDEAEDEAGDE